jgi:hypothetical protein
LCVRVSHLGGEGFRQAIRSATSLRQKRRLELVWGQGDRFAVVTGVPVFVTNLVVLCRLGDAIDGNRQ